MEFFFSASFSALVWLVAGYINKIKVGTNSSVLHPESLRIHIEILGKS